MKPAVVAAVALSMALPALAQEKDRAIVIDEVEAVVTVVEVDQDARTVVLRGPQGNTVDLTVPPESQNLDQVHPGAKFKVKYLQSVAVSIAKGRAASSSSGQSVQLAAKGDTPGGTIVSTRNITGVVESIDYTSRLVSVRGPEGRLLIITVDDSVQDLDQIQKDDAITVEYTESLALRMIKE